MSQSEPAVGWGSPLHAWLASVNWIGSARYLNRGYRYGARGMHYHILLRQYNQNHYTYNSVVNKGQVRGRELLEIGENQTWYTVRVCGVLQLFYTWWESEKVNFGLGCKSDEAIANLLSVC